MANCSNVDSLICLCSKSKVSLVLFPAWFVSYILLLPVFMSVLHLSHKKWKKHPLSAVSHSDVFTLHMVSIELLAVLGSILFSWGLFARINSALLIGKAICSFAINGQLFFHLLTCVERYLAVVHPITYLRLKKRGGVTIRNISVGFVWVLSVCNSLCMLYSVPVENLMHLSLVIFSLALVSFCSVSVICVLIRPGPGERCVTKKQLNHSKKSAFYTIMVILAVLVARLVNSMIYQIFFLLDFLGLCLVVAFGLLSALPSSLVLPLLFLHRARTRQHSTKTS